VSGLTLISGVLVAELGVEADDEALLVGGEVAALDVGAEVVGPAEAAALPAAVQPGGLGQVAPAANLPAVPLDVLHQGAVLLLRPRAFLHAGVVAAARGPPHLLLPAKRLRVRLDVRPGGVQCRREICGPVPEKVRWSIFIGRVSLQWMFRAWQH